MTDPSLFQAFLNQRSSGAPAFGSNRFVPTATNSGLASETSSNSFDPSTGRPYPQSSGYTQDPFGVGQSTGLTPEDVQALITNYKRPWNPESYWSLSS